MAAILAKRSWHILAETQSAAGNKGRD